jgi:hypothetical protein
VGKKASLILLDFTARESAFFQNARNPFVFPQP